MGTKERNGGPEEGNGGRSPSTLGTGCSPSLTGGRQNIGSPPTLGGAEGPGEGKKEPSDPNQGAGKGEVWGPPQP